MKKRLLLFAALLCLLGTGAHAASPDSASVAPLRLVASSTMVTMGRADVLDTYLSPLDYDGLHLGVHNERMQVAGYGRGKWVKRQMLSVEFSFNDTRSGNGSLTTGFLSGRWGAMRRIGAVPGLALMAGPYLGADLGFLYNVRNSNNPADAKISVEAGAMATAVYRLAIWPKLPVTLRYTASLPVVSAFFSPHYEQSYYEIFSLGNTKGIVRVGTFGNRFDIDNLVTADLPLGALSLRVGYLGRIHNTHVNDIKTRRVSNSFVVGFVREFAPLSMRRPGIPTRRAVSAYSTR
jgi:hypothetical protein